MGRDPRWGRSEESISECPWLNAAYASAVVRGMQQPAPGETATNITKIAACCKHFYGYSLEGGAANVSDGWTRHTFDAAISKRDLMETYLPAFAACAAAGVEQVMCRCVSQLPLPPAAASACCYMALFTANSRPLAVYTYTLCVVSAFSLLDTAITLSTACPRASMETHRTVCSVARWASTE